jgi:hypothetical protein
MHSPQSRLIATFALALALTLGAPDSSIAQRSKGDEGTGGAAGYSPPVDMPGGGAPMPDAAPMNAPPMPPPDEGASQGAPAPDQAAPDQAAPDQAPGDGTKKDDGTLPPDAPMGPDQPD